MRERLVLGLAITAGLWMYAGAVGGIADLDRRLAFAWFDSADVQTIRSGYAPGPGGEPAVPTTPVHFRYERPAGCDEDDRERPVPDRTL